MTTKIEEHLKQINALVEANELYTFTFNTQQLPPHKDFSIDIRAHESFNKLFSELNKKRGFCIYWFSCATNDEAKALVKKLDAKRSQLLNTGNEHRRVVPPENSNKDSKVIYVGVRQKGHRQSDGLTNIAGRMIQHLGYYKPGSTGALQLLHWAEGYDCKITINVLELPEPKETQYLYILEKLFAIELKPLCGKH